VLLHFFSANGSPVLLLIKKILRVLVEINLHARIGHNEG
jgi:hypothetical protein